MKKFLKILVILIVLGLVVIISSPSIYWDGGVYRKFTITILDNVTNRPIEGAEVIMFQDSGFRVLEKLEEQEKKAFLESRRAYDNSFTLSNSDGVAEPGRMFPAGGGSFLGFQTGGFMVSGPLIIQKEGYIAFEGLLQNIVSQKNFPLSKENFSFNIYLQKNSKQGKVTKSDFAPLRLTSFE